MRILARTRGMSREKWLSLRKTGIGGSDAAVICGLSPFKSKIELWADKTNRMPEKEDTDAMRTGRDLEEYVAQRFSEATGKKVRRCNAIFQHELHDFIIADIDRDVCGENAGLECKTTSAFAKSDFENGEIPQYYYAQCTHYMNVMGYDKMYLAVLVGGQKFYWYEIQRNEDDCLALLEQEVQFWRDYIAADVRPDPDGSDSAQRTLEQIYGKNNINADDASVKMCYDLDNQVEDYIKLKAKIADLQAQEALYKQKLITALGGFSSAVTSDYSFSWKPQTRNTVDTKALKRDYPEIYNKCKKENTSMIFRINERKEK